MPCKFTPEAIAELFGSEAAEQEDPARLRKYFFKNKTYEDIRANLPLRILVAHKGIGKSAMFKVCFDEDADSNQLSLWVRPDDLLDLKFDATNDLNALIRNWKVGLTSLLSSKIVEFAGDLPNGEIVRRISSTGAALINSFIKYLGEKLKTSIDPAMKSTVSNFLTARKIIVYIDDLDRGWEGSPADIRKVSALLNALRDMSTDHPGLYFRVALRADVYFLVRTSDESTDKIEGSVVWYNWTNHEIFKILVKRVASYFGQTLEDAELGKMQQIQMSSILENVMEARFAGQGHWRNAPMHKVLLSLVRKRPRDLIKLCSEAAANARRRDSEILTTQDFKAIFENYSQGRLQDTINEYKTELPAIERLLFGMKPGKKERRAALGYKYNTGELLNKIKDIEEQGKFSFSNGKFASERDLANFLYKINFLTARKERPDGKIDRKYFEENRYLSSQFVDFGYEWEVHPAYRWALQPNDIDDIFEKLGLTEMEF